MKIALLADIHGNDVALASVLNAAREAAATRLLIAGDFVGYYYKTKSVLDLLATWDWAGVRGNHEDMLRTWADGYDHEDLRQRYGSGLETACEELPQASIDMLTTLPETCELALAGKTALICHGSPWDPVAYIYPDAAPDIWRKFTTGGQDLVLFGHSHYPVIWREGSTLVVNPGSVGQPRDYRPGACWALWDTDSHTVTLQREPYDAEPVISECQRRDPGLSYLQDVLVRTA